MSKHTPGPWRVIKVDDNDYRSPYEEDFAVVGTDLVTPCIVFEFGSVGEANAKLISMAPSYHEHSHILAMLGLQSERYQQDPEFKKAVDNVLSIFRHVESED